MNHINPKNIIYGEQSMFSFYIKYENLFKLIDIHYKDKGNESNELNIFIDLYSVLRSVFVRLGTSNIVCKSDSFIASGVINMCAHYREFFRRYYNVSTKIFIINSGIVDESNNIINNYFIKNYRKDYSSKPMNNATINEVNNYLKINIMLLKQIIPYINDIHFIDSDLYEFGVKVLEVLSHDGYKSPSIVITRDLYNISLLGYEKNIKILRPKKDIDGKDVSFIIDESNFLDILCHERNVKRIPNNISPELISLILTLTRVPERYIKSLFNQNKVITILNGMINNNEMNNARFTDMGYFYSLFSIHIKNKHKVEEIANRFNAIDILNQYQMSKEFPSGELYQGILNLYDPMALKTLNEKIFINNPLDIMGL